VHNVISERPKLNLKSLRNLNTENVHNTTDAQTDATVSSTRFKNSQKEPNMETYVKS